MQALGSRHGVVRLGLGVAFCASFGMAATVTPQGSGCEAEWTSPFGVSPRVQGSTRSLALFDDGDGVQLCTGGNYSYAGDPDQEMLGVLRTDGVGLDAIASVPGGKTVRALASFDAGVDGSGAKLFRGGNYPIQIERWDGTQWNTIGGLPMGHDVDCLFVYDDGSGEALYAGGNFSSVNGIPMEAIARWDGQVWSSVGVLDGNVIATAVFDDGSGPALFAGGAFSDIGGAGAGKLAKWDGTVWSKLSVGINGRIQAMQVFDDGSQSTLVIGGEFTTVAGQTVNHIARWDGSSWSGFDNGFDDTVYALAVFDGGSGPELIAGGGFDTIGGNLSRGLARWDGAQWQVLDASLSSVDILALLVVNQGDLPIDSELLPGLYFSGPTVFFNSGPLRWDGQSVESVLQVTEGRIDIAEVLDDGNGPALYAGGSFDVIAGLEADGAALWDGSQWTVLGTLLGGVRDFEVFDAGNGPVLYAGTAFGGVASWDGAAWTEVSPLTGSVESLAVFDDGSGSALYAAGSFDWSIDGQTLVRIGRWDGSSWQAVGGGFTATSGVIEKLTVFDFGAGPELVAAGRMVAELAPLATDVVRWNGSQWSDVGNLGFTNFNDIAIYDDGQGAGPRLYVAGLGQQSGVKRWNGASWESIAGSQTNISALGVVDDGTGSKLLGSVAFNDSIHAFDGSAWTVISNLNPSPVYSIEPALGFGGPSAKALMAGSSRLDAWGTACESPGTYCTSKLSSAGCSAAVGTTNMTAQPISGAADYSVTAQTVQGFKNGHLFVGISGAASIPFLGGTLCVQPPTKRGQTMNSGGSGPESCDGSFTQLVNDGTLIPFGLDPGPGNSAWYQWWHRDPASGPGSLGSAFSNGIQLDFN